jgi:hypothetical protein
MEEKKMAEKKQIIKKEVTVSKAIREVKKDPENKGEQIEFEAKETVEPGVSEEVKLSSLELFWKHALGELDEWSVRADYRDEVFLKAAKVYAETIRRNRDNVKAINEQFVKEMAEWERTAREEFLMTTTAIQHFVPVRSYEEINQMFDNLQSKASSILYAPFRAVAGSEPTDKAIDMIEQFIRFRKESRMQYIRNVKQTANQIYENQKVFVNLFTNQIKTVLFPFNKYLEKTEDLVK